MADFMKKLNTINKRLHFATKSSKSSFEESASSILASEPIVAKFKEDTRNLPINNPHKEAEILEGIEKVYFNDATFDASLYELESLPESLDAFYTNTQRKKLKEQLAVVSKKVSDLILENDPSYAVELQKVTELQRFLKDTLVVCRRSRESLHGSQAESTVGCLKVLTLCRKEKRLRSYLDALRNIKTLEETDIRLRELLQEENFPRAIQLCMECLKAAESFKHYACISELSTKLGDTLREAEMQLDLALAAICLNFHADQFSRLHAAYALLGKNEMAVERLIHHFAAVTQSSAISILSDNCGFTEDNVQGISYADLCQQIPVDKFIVCLSELCKILWKVMVSYQSVIKWYDEQGSLLNYTEDGEVAGLSSEQNLAETYRAKFVYSLKGFWQDIEQSINTPLQYADLTGFKFDNFLTVLRIAQTTISIGKSHFDSDSDSLRETVRQQSLAYFKHYHRARIDELRMFLEVEAWEVCPVKTGFSIFDLREFWFLKKKAAGLLLAQQDSTVVETVEVREVSPKRQLQWLWDGENPFCDTQDDDAKAEAFNENETRSSEDSDDDVNEDLKKDFIDETGAGGAGKGRPAFKRHQSYRAAAKLPPILSNAALMVIRLFGRYLHMIDLLEPIAFDVAVSLSQLFDYYFYCVFHFFGRDGADRGGMTISQRLSQALRRTEDNLILMKTDTEARSQEFKMTVPRISSLVNLSDKDNLFGAAERIVAVESVIYMAKQMQDLRCHLEKSIPESKRPFLQQFYSQTVASAVDLRSCVLGGVAARALDYGHIVTLVSCVNWDVGELLSQHSQYVDLLLKDLSLLNQRLAEVSRKVPVPKEVYNVMWELCLVAVCRTLVEGFSNAKKCTTEGRALMQLDFRQFLQKVEKLIDLRPIPGVDYVETYIKAYYLPESSLEQWVKDRKEYSVKHVMNLLHVANISKRMKQKLIAGLEEQNLLKTTSSPTVVH